MAAEADRQAGLASPDGASHGSLQRFRLSAPSQMTLRYLLVLVVLGLLAVVHYASSAFLLNINDTTATLISASAQQRNLILYAVQMADELVEAKEAQEQLNLRHELLVAAREIEKTLDTLYHGGVQGDDAAQWQSSPDIRAIFTKPPYLLQSRTETLVASLEDLARADAATLTPENLDYQNIIALIRNQEMLSAVDAIVNQYTKEAEARLQTLKIVNLIEVLVMIGVLVLMGLMVFRPMVAAVRRHTDALQNTNLSLGQELELRKKIEKHLKDSEERIRAIVNTVFDGIVTVDAKGTIQFVNPATEKLFLYTVAELYGKSLEILMPAFRPELLHDLKDEPNILLRDVRGLRKDGQKFPMQVAFTNYELDGQQFYTCLLRDVTEQKRFELSQKRLTRKLQHSNRELQDFAVVASHDLQEPLRKIQAFSERLRKFCAGELGEQGRDYVERMENAAQRMSVLINDLLVYSRVTTKSRPFSRVELNTVLAGVLQDMELRIEELGAQIDIQPLPVIEADATQMRQLFTNLVGNALKFHRPDAKAVVKVYASAPEQGSAEDYVGLTIEDNGIGFDNQFQEKIFEVFHRLHGRNQYEGTGVGLAICRKIIERHNGRISAYGEPGQGSRFVITLPKRQSQEDDEDSLDPVTTSSTTTYV